jgi:hypothetical protein
MKALEIVLTVLISISLGIASFSLAWMFNTNAKVAVMSEKLFTMSEKLDIALQDTETDSIQNRQLSKHWKLHGWAKDEINVLRVKNGSNMTSWPELND